MAAGEYLKVAAAQLRRAAQERKADADNFRKQIFHKEQEKKDSLKVLKQEEQFHQTAVVNARDGGQRHFQIQNVSQIRNQESETERTFNRIKDDFARMANDAERDADDLTRRAGELESRAAQM